MRVLAEDAERLAVWRSWLDREFMSEDWDRNLWDEFYGLFFRRAMWRNFREMFESSPEDVRAAAALARQWVLRNHIETQAMAIRRIANRTSDLRPISLVRLLDEIGEHPNVIGANATAAREDADRIDTAAEKVSTFANKVVAHLDADHAAASRDVSLEAMDQVVDVIGHVWERWYRAVTGAVAPAMEPAGVDWSYVVRLHLRDPSIDNPEALGARIRYILGDAPARELLGVLERTPEARASLIGRLWSNPQTRTLAEILLDIESDSDDLVRLRLVDGLRRTLGA
jgi:hypothetical protein